MLAPEQIEAVYDHCMDAWGAMEGGTDDVLNALMRAILIYLVANASPSVAGADADAE